MKFRHFNVASTPCKAILSSFKRARLTRVDAATFSKFSLLFNINWEKH